jgi:hypothetical protein
MRGLLYGFCKKKYRNFIVLKTLVGFYQKKVIYLKNISNGWVTFWVTQYKWR